MTEQPERQPNIEERFASLHASFARMDETDAQIRAVLAEHREDLQRVSRNLDEFSAILDRIEQRNAECPTCDGTGGDHQIGCGEGEL